MSSEERKSAIRVGLWLLSLFIVLAVTSGVRAATWFVACGVVGYFNASYVFRSLFRLIRRQRTSIRAWLLAVTAFAASSVIIVLGSAGDSAVLIVATLGFIWIDAFGQRFR